MIWPAKVMLEVSITENKHTGGRWMARIRTSPDIPVVALVYASSEEEARKRIKPTLNSMEAEGTIIVEDMTAKNSVSSNEQEELS